MRLSASAARMQRPAAPVRRRQGRKRPCRKAPTASTAISARDALAEAALGWLLESYRFTRYKSSSRRDARLVAPEGVDAARLEAIAAGECLTRDLINVPAADMGPAELEAAARELAEEIGRRGLGDRRRGAAGAELSDDPRRWPRRDDGPRAAADRADLGRATGPKLTLVGKGVCFDTGGLDLKPAASMGLMKKDMGGAATVLGLARMIMALKLRLRLRVLVPAVENAVSGASFRPQDVLTSRKGLTVEINNTDAEGRLVLADALAYACEDAPDLVVSMATLTGAARVAVGPDLAPFYHRRRRRGGGADRRRARASPTRSGGCRSTSPTRR